MSWTTLLHVTLPFHSLLSNLPLCLYFWKTAYDSIEYQVSHLWVTRVKNRLFDHKVWKESRRGLSKDLASAYWGATADQGDHLPYMHPRVGQAVCSLPVLRWSSFPPATEWISLLGTVDWDFRHTCTHTHIRTCMCLYTHRYTYIYTHMQHKLSHLLSWSITWNCKVVLRTRNVFSGYGKVSLPKTVSWIYLASCPKEGKAYGFIEYFPC